MKRVNEYEQKLSDKVFELTALGHNKEADKYRVRDGHISIFAAAYLMGIQVVTLRSMLSRRQIALPTIKVSVSALRKTTRIMLAELIIFIDSRK